MAIGALEDQGLTEVANILNALCTCPEYWRGRGLRPACVVHEEKISDGKASG